MTTKSDYDTLVDMGFSPDKVTRALKAVKNAGLQPAMDWLIAHPGDNDEPEGGAKLGENPSGEEIVEASSSLKSAEEIRAEDQTAQSLVCEDCQKLFRDANSAERHAIKSGHVNFSESTTAIKPLTEEEKAAKKEELKRVLAEKRELRLIQEKEEAKSREKVRRKTGQELSEIKAKLEEKEMQKALIAKKKEKEEERLAKAKIKAQIEADKKERAAKREASKQANLQHQQEIAIAEAAAAANVSKEYSEARLQIRLPSGSPITHTFQSTDTLQIVYDHVSQHVSESFNFMTTFPRKMFGDSDMEKSLKELGI
ncbi:11131_t:CDS:2 [Diversispora eburnea]|uniref:11131_t:CDS:1 n=1 Tax=Diversispora eburnea TaxID=1213867 RepID=A0A9N8ZZM1_9GLOM|nr:11131_t:CDS:2 [Diversispora eburnea]